jgi:hypothetical protein
LGRIAAVGLVLAAVVVAREANGAEPAPSPTAAATLAIAHPGRTIGTASSYTAGGFSLRNASTAGEDITGFSIDLADGPAMWPDLAFDPADGSPAGDTVSKSFTVDTGTSSGLSAHAGYQVPIGAGYSVLDVDTSGFDPGDTLRFSIDIDPTSIRGVSGNPTPDAGGIGGAELSGATLTVRFSNGGERTTDISLKPGSKTDGRATASAGTPGAPGLSRLSGASPAAVSSASQTVVVSGPAGAAGVVVVAEGQLNVKNVPGGGYDLDPWEANTAVRLDEVSFTIGAGGTVNVPITLHATPDADAKDVGLNYVTAHLVSGGVPGPVSDPVILKLGDAPAVDTTPPTLTGRQPAAGATGVAAATNVVATFSEAMAPGSITGSSFTLAPSAGGAAVPASIAASAGNTTFTLNPSADLAPGTAYTATVTTAAEDAAGNDLASTQTWSFITADASAPANGAVTFVGGQAVVEAEDADGAIGRAGDNWQPGGPAGSAGGALSVVPDNGSGATGDVVSTSPELSYRVDFPAAGTYYLWLRASAPDGAGNSVHSGLDGALGASYLNLYQYGAWTWVGTLFTGARATVTVPSAGVHTVHVWMREDGFSLDRLLLTTGSGFTPSGTGPAATPREGGGDPDPDTTAPTVTGRTPAPGATGVAAGANVVATFSEPMDPATLTGATVSLAPTAGGPAVAASVAVSGGGAVATLDPSADLAAQTQYTATVAGSAADVAGNPLGAPQSWSFTTAAAPAPGDGAVTFAGGQAVVEAEDPDARVARGGKDWLAGQSPSGSAGDAMKALPDTGARITGSIPTTSPELAYRVSFPAAGTYQLWLRMYGISNGNTLHAGIDGAATAQNVTVPTGAWRWVKVAVSVPSAGEHTVHAWMREDGVGLDRLLLTTSTSFTPSGSGPAATPRS